MKEVWVSIDAGILQGKLKCSKFSGVSKKDNAEIMTIFQKLYMRKRCWYRTI